MSTSDTYTIKVSVGERSLELHGRLSEPSHQKMLGHLSPDLLVADQWLRSLTTETMGKSTATQLPLQGRASKSAKDVVLSGGYGLDSVGG